MSRIRSSAPSRQPPPTATLRGRKRSARSSLASTNAVPEASRACRVGTWHRLYVPPSRPRTPIPSRRLDTLVDEMTDTADETTTAGTALRPALLPPAGRTPRRRVAGSAHHACRVPDPRDAVAGDRRDPRPTRPGCCTLLRTQRFPAVASVCGSGVERRRRTRASPRGGAVPAAPLRAHLAGIRAGGGRGPAVVARGARRLRHGLARESEPHPGVRPADPGTGSHADVEPVGGGGSTRCCRCSDSRCSGCAASPRIGASRSCSAWRS